MWESLYRAASLIDRSRRVPVTTQVYRYMRRRVRRAVYRSNRKRPSIRR